MSTHKDALMVVAEKLESEASRLHKNHEAHKDDFERALKKETDARNRLIDTCEENFAAVRDAIENRYEDNTRLTNRLHQDALDSLKREEKIRSQLADSLLTKQEQFSETLKAQDLVTERLTTRCASFEKQLEEMHKQIYESKKTAMDASRTSTDKAQKDVSILKAHLEEAEAKSRAVADENKLLLSKIKKLEDSEETTNKKLREMQAFVEKSISEHTSSTAGFDRGIKQLLARMDSVESAIEAAAVAEEHQHQQRLRLGQPRRLSPLPRQPSPARPQPKMRF